MVHNSHPISLPLCLPAEWLVDEDREATVEEPVVGGGGQRGGANSTDHSQGDGSQHILHVLAAQVLRLVAE